jgi:hypothetical protein
VSLHAAASFNSSKSVRVHVRARVSLFGDRFNAIFQLRLTVEKRSKGCCEAAKVVTRLLGRSAEFVYSCVHLMPNEIQISSLIFRSGEEERGGEILATLPFCSESQAAKCKCHFDNAHVTERRDVSCFSDRISDDPFQRDSSREFASAALHEMINFSGRACRRVTLIRPYDSSCSSEKLHRR